MPNLEFVTVPDIVFALASFLLVYYFKELTGNVKKAVQSVDELNSKVGIIIERTETHSHEIEILREKTDNITSDVAHIKAHINPK